MQGFRELFDSVSKIQFSNDPNGSIVYNFKVGEESYIIYFKPTDAAIQDQSIKGFEIGLTGPKGHLPTGQNIPFSIYPHLIQASKQFIETYKPELIEFAGAVGAQNLVYDKFYERYMKKAYTRYGFRYYIRNDIMQKFQPNPEFLQGGQQIEKQRRIKHLYRVRRGYADTHLEMQPPFIALLIMDQTSEPEIGVVKKYHAARSVNGGEVGRLATFDFINKTHTNGYKTVLPLVPEEITTYAQQIAQLKQKYPNADIFVTR